MENVKPIKPLIISLIISILSILCLIYLIVPWAATHGPLSDNCIELSYKGYFDAGDFRVHDSCLEGEYEWADNCTVKWNPTLVPPFTFMEKYGAGSEVRCLIKFPHTKTWDGNVVKYNKTCNKNLEGVDSRNFALNCIKDIFPSLLWIMPQMLCYCVCIVSIIVLFDYFFGKEDGENETY